MDLLNFTIRSNKTIITYDTSCHRAQQGCQVSAVSGSVSCLMYSILRILLIILVSIVHHSLCILGGNQRTIFVDSTLSSEIVSGLETKDQLDEVL